MSLIRVCVIYIHDGQKMVLFSIIKDQGFPSASNSNVNKRIADSSEQRTFTSLMLQIPIFWFRF